METRNFINGKFVDAISNEKISIINPANQKVVGKIDQALDDEINSLIKILACSKS